MARNPMSDRNEDTFVPRFREEHKTTGGRAFGIKKVPQTAMFEITGEGAGDLPAALKGRFTSTGRAERSLKAYLQSQRILLEALQAKQARAQDERDTLTLAEAKKDETPEPEAKAKITDLPEDKPKAPKGGSKVPVTVKDEEKSD